jgi:hypothetical protein
MIEKEHCQSHAGPDKLEIFYVVYILSSGLIDDLADVLISLDPSWDKLPI